MQLSANTQVKTIEGHYTGHFKAVVTKPQNVYVMRDVAAAGYVAGGNCLFFARNPGKPLSDPDSHTTAACRESLQTRLSFSNDVGAKYASMLSFPMFESQLDDPTTCLDTTMSVTSRLLPWEVAGTVSNGTHTSFPGGEEAFKIYNAQLGLRSIHFGEDMKAAENQDFISQALVQNPSTPKLAPSKLTHCVLVCVHRVRPTMLFASLVRIASTTPSPEASTRSRPAKATGARTRSLEMRGGDAESPFRSRRRGTAWCRSRLRRTRRWPSARSRNEIEYRSRRHNAHISHNKTEDKTEKRRTSAFSKLVWEGGRGKKN